MATGCKATSLTGRAGGATRRQGTSDDSAGTLWVMTLMLALAPACGGPVLDMGQDKPPCPVQRPCYAPLDTLGSEPANGAPTIVAAHQYAATALAIDATRIYWTTQVDGTQSNPQAPSETAVVRSCAKGDCAGTLVTYATQQHGATKIAVNDRDVFWTRNTDEMPVTSAIVACAIAGCTGDPRVVVTGTTTQSLTVDGDNVYWLSTDALLRCPVSGCEGAPVVVAQLGTPTAFSFFTNNVVVDGASIFLAMSNGDLTARIVELDKDGAQPMRVIAEGLQPPQSLAVDAANVYWSEAVSASINSCSRTGCTGSSGALVKRSGYAALLAVQPDGVQWFSSPAHWFSSMQPAGTVELLACPSTGCASSPAVLATDTDGPTAIAADASHVYWTTHGQRKYAEMVRQNPQPSGPVTSSRGPYADGAVKRIRRRP